MGMRSVVSVRPTVSTLAVNQLTYDTDFSLLAYPRDATLARVLATALRSSVCVSVCLSVCLSQVGVLSKPLNESS